MVLVWGDNIQPLTLGVSPPRYPYLQNSSVLTATPFFLSPKFPGSFLRVVLGSVASRKSRKLLELSGLITQSAESKIDFENL